MRALLRASVVVVTLCPLLLAGAESPAPAAQTNSDPQAPSDKEDPYAKMTLEELLKVVVTSASKISQLTSDAPSIISVVPRYHIDSFGWLSINDILYKQPGFAPSQDYDRRTVSSRGAFEGWNNNHLLLLIDGIPYNDNLYGTAYTSEITPLFFTKSVEILRGPGSALYGSNATNGAVTLKTLSASDLDNSVRASVRVGDHATRIYDAIGGTTQSLASVVLGYSWLETNGNEYFSYDGSHRTGSDGQLLKFRTHDARQNDYAFAKVEGHGKLEGLSVQYHQQQWDFGTGHGWIFYIPDFDENMHESRQILSVQYDHTSKSGLNQEYAIRYQNHDISWNQRYYPNDAIDPYGTSYPAGLWEFLKTSAADYFTRAQFTYPWRANSSFIGGLETSTFLYDGDREHFSNANINYGEDYSPTADGRMKDLNPWLEWIDGQPVLNVGVFAQFSTGEMLGSKVSATAGVRFDRQSFDFHALDVEGKPKESKSFERTSPRLALVFKPNHAVTIKALAGKAFRAPSPTELFGANTYSLASNLRQLKPEIVTTYEVATEWRATNDILLRLNAYHNEFDNQIAYSVANANLSTNVYSLKTDGLETELLVGFKRVSGFFNYSFAKRLDEEIIDPTVAVSRHTLTWYPSQVGNVGALYDTGKVTGSLSLHYQGRVRRRASDSADSLFAPYRPSSVKSWLSLDGNFAFRPANKVELSLRGTNLLNKNDHMLLKNNAFPFDYRSEGRRVSLNTSVIF